MIRNNRWRVASLSLLTLLGLVAGAVYAAGYGSSDTEVRVNAIRLDDGRVEVGIQQRDSGGEWSERQLPEHRFLRPTSRGVWLNSSPVSIVTDTAHDADAMSEDAMGEAEAMPEPVEMPEPAPAKLYCVIHHGPDHDPFWLNFNTVAAANAAELGLTNVEIAGYAEITDQAAAIADCADRGALGIASSIPDLDGLEDALNSARTSGAFLVTFNSGADVAGQVGSTVHYGLNDRAAGELAGRKFTDAGLTGTILCVSHEPVNIGLQDRCEGLESGYAGAVENVRLQAGSLTDPVATGTAIATAIGEHDADGVLVLNAAMSSVAIGVVQHLQSDALVGSIGRSQFALVQVYEGQLLFAIDDGAIAQASHVMLSLKNVDSSPSIRAMLALTAQQAPDTTTMLIRPVAMDKDYIDNLPSGWMDQVCALAAQLAPDQAPSFCQ